MSTEPESAPMPLVEALRKKVKHLESELEDAEARIDELEEDNQHFTRRLEKLEEELGIGGERYR